MAAWPFDDPQRTPDAADFPPDGGGRAPKTKRPQRCQDCNSRNPYLMEDFDGRWVCQHRYACQARQMLAVGVPIEKAAAHAQKERPW